MLLNVGGQAGPAALLAEEQPDAILLVETHRQAGERLPQLPGFGRCFEAPRPATAAGAGRGGVAQLWADEQAARVEMWRSRPADGVVWVRITGALLVPLHVALCYIAPRGSGGAPADEDRWWLQLAQEAAEAEAAGLVVLTGDVNSRTRVEPDWPPGAAGCGQRVSADRAPPNSYGRQLLQLCRSSTLRLCNGRDLGGNSGAPTSYGTAGGGSAVVDYFAVSESLLPSVLQLQVAGLHPAALFSDHAALHLEISLSQPQRGQPEQPPAAAAAAQQQGSQQGAGQRWRGSRGSLKRFRLLPELLGPAVEALRGLAEGLEAAAEAAASAATGQEVEAAADMLTAVVCQALTAAGMPRASAAGGRQQQRALPRHLRQQFGIREARRLARQALRRAGSGEGPALWPEERRQLRRQLCRASRAARSLREKQLEQLAVTDFGAFCAIYRDRRSNTQVGSAGVGEEELCQHFRALLGAEEDATGEETEEEDEVLGGEEVQAVAEVEEEAAQQPAPARPPPEPPPQQRPPPEPPPAGRGGSSQQGQPDVASLAAALHAPFTAAAVVEGSKRIKRRKAVAGSLPAWFVKAAAAELAPALAELFNAWVRVGQVSEQEALSIIQPLLKPRSDPACCASYRGIAVGTLAAKLYAALLEQRVSAWAEAGGSRAEGQFGFRRQRSTAQAAFVLRTLQDQHRQDGQQLWACFVDFKQAYDRVPRRRLWRRLQARGLGGSWLQAVQALYADVPMAVRTASGVAAPFQARQGVKQGCPLSPTLFGMYIDDFEAAVLAAAAEGRQLDLPVFSGSDSPVPPLLYADDMVLLATSAAGLQQQLDLLQRYCQRQGLTVNTVKTKLMLLSGQRRQGDAQRAAEAARLCFGGQRLEAVTSFTYLGIMFHSTQQLASTAVAARAGAARAALHKCNARCAELGVQAAPLRMRLFSSMVDSVLSYGAEVWGLQLAARAAASGGSTGCPAQRLHLAFYRMQLGVSQATPAAVVLAEAGERPLWMRWLQRGSRLLSRCLQAAEGSLLQRALTASCRLAAGGAQRSWAAQLQAGLEAVGVQLDLQQPEAVGRAQLRDACRARQAAMLNEAASKEGASRMQHYVLGTCGGVVEPGSLAQPQPVLSLVRERQRRQALMQLRAGTHCGAEETGRCKRPRVPREQRVCPYCNSGAIETVPHMVFDCPLYADLRAQFADLFARLPVPRDLHLHHFLRHDDDQCTIRLARFATALYRTRAAAPSPAAAFEPP